MILEENWRRNEANMRRKQHAQLANGAITPSSEAPPSPASTGAMDTLLEKLRAAAPQNKDTRERRRRARLKDKHQVRVASGQKIPETGENIDESGLLSPTKTEGSDDAGSAEGAVSEGEDIADRAATMLQGLRGDGEHGLSEAPARDDSLRVRRRRESADDERLRRRARRRAGGTSADQPHSIIMEEGKGADTPEAEAEDAQSRADSEDAPLQSPPPVTVVVPPSPTLSERGLAGE